MTDKEFQWVPASNIESARKCGWNEAPEMEHMPTRATIFGLTAVLMERDKSIMAEHQSPTARKQIG